MAPRRPWFRVYVEMVHDRKIRRLSPEHRWLWVTILACARASPTPGWLLLSDRQPLTQIDLADEAALDEATVADGLTLLEREGLIEMDSDVASWFVPRWKERQYESDTSSQRTAKWRSRKRRENESATPDVTASSRAPATESESEVLKVVSPSGRDASDDADDDDDDSQRTTTTRRFTPVGDNTDELVNAAITELGQRDLRRWEDAGHRVANRGGYLTRCIANRSNERSALWQLALEHPDWGVTEIADAQDTATARETAPDPLARPRLPAFAGNDFPEQSANAHGRADEARKALGGAVGRHPAGANEPPPPDDDIEPF